MYEICRSVWAFFSSDYFFNYKNDRKCQFVCKYLFRKSKKKIFSDSLKLNVLCSDQLIKHTHPSNPPSSAYNTDHQHPAQPYTPSAAH